jgi:putative spermidine/putrescine transport system substrate-binding protein
MLKSMIRGVLPMLAAAATVLAVSWSPAMAKELRVLAWQGYADDDWVKEFKKESGADVKVVFIGSDDEIWAKIKGSEGKDFDVMAVNTGQLQRYIDAKLVQPIDLSKVPNQKANQLPIFNDLTKVKGVMRDGQLYAVPFCFDSIGIIYNTDEVKTPPTSMDVLWDPQYKGKVLAYDNGEHNFSFTALTMGIQDPFHLSADQMAQIKAKLIKLKGNVLSFYTTADEATQIYKQNDVALIWANYGQQQVKSLQDAGAHVAYVNPKEGALAWLDTWAITTGAQDKDLAEAWINFLMKKEIGAQLTERSGFGNTVAPSSNAKPDDKLVYVETVEDPTKRADLWNEIKAAQ